MEPTIDELEDAAEGLNTQYRKCTDEYIRTSDPATLEKALSFIQQAVAKTASFSFARNGTRAAHLTNLSRCLALSYKATGNTKDIDDAVDTARRAVETVPEASINRPMCYINLSDSLADRYFAKGSSSLADFDEAIEQARKAVSAAGEKNSYRGNAMSTLASRLSIYYQRINSKDEFLEEATRIDQELVDSTSKEDEMYGIYTINLAVDMKTLWGRYGRLQDLRKAKEQFGVAVIAFPRGHHNHTMAVREFAGVVIDLADATHEPQELEVALQRMIDIEPSMGNNQELAKLLHQKSRLYAMLYQQASKVEYVNLAVEAAERALAVVPKESMIRGQMLDRLSNTLGTRAETQTSIEDIDAAIRYARQYIELTQDLPAQQSYAYTTLGNRLSLKFSMFGGEGHLKEALVARRMAVDLLPLDHKSRPTRLHAVANNLRDLFEFQGSLKALDESILLEREASKALSPDDPDRCMVLDGLSHSLSLRFKRLAHSQDIEEAVSASEIAVAGMPAGHHERSAYLNGLGNRLSRRYETFKQKEDLDRAIVVVTEAISATTPGSDSEYIYMTTLGNIYNNRYTAYKEVEDLDKSIDLARQVIEKVPVSSPTHTHSLHNLGVRLQTKYFLSLDQEQKHQLMKEAHTLAQQCVEATLESHPDLPSYLSQLANRQLFLALFMDESDEAALLAQLRKSAETYRRGFSMTYDPPLARIRNAQLGANNFMGLKDWDAAGTMLSEAVQLFRKASPASLDEQDRQIQLKGLSGLSSMACACYISLGKPAQALEVLESGRGILANIAMGYHKDLSGIRQADEALYTEYVDLRDKISQPMQIANASAAHGEDAVAKRNADSTQLEAVETRIRKLPGLESFNMNLSSLEMRALAKEGPLVAFSTVDQRCDALVATTESIEVVHLPDLINAELKARIALVVGANRLSLLPPSKRGIANRRMRQLLEWLWDKAVQPVLAHLKLLDESENASEPKSRLWWVASGPLGLLPLHAAGKGEQHPAQNAYAHIVSSYIPNFSSLAFARQCQAMVDTASPAMALITMPETAGGLNPLSTDNETRAIRKAYSESSLTAARELLELRQPSAEQVHRHIRSSNVDILHIACHAEPDFNDPAMTALLFGPDPTLPAPDPLPVHDLRHQSSAFAERRPPRLAYLSACCTAQQYDLGLIDESIHLASAFQLCGFPAVIGTFWEADDTAAVVVAEAFYEELFRLDRESRASGSGDHVARAIDHATGVYREIKVGRLTGASDVLAWASFVHIGA
ncbi:CHAT domain-containing protein [Lophiotrema nucula]|uniref:CHAT domain-containing protein n=1 Tax=Lophiotrema nucula TaxID=690887 RepID=A0A6A5ZVL4_9PLEO|nr:CHAT domain-containing protein [Lophiotrema nucula]